MTTRHIPEGGRKDAVRFETPEPNPCTSVAMPAIAGEELRLNRIEASDDRLKGMMQAPERFDLAESGYLGDRVVGLERAHTWKAGTIKFIGDNKVFHATATSYLGNIAIAAWRQLRDNDPTTAAM